MTAREPYLRSFGRRKGRALSARQRELVKTALPRLRADLSVPFSDAGAIFDRPVADLWLEIGFGAGEHLLWQAARNPTVGIIGCEPYLNGVASLLGRLDVEPLSNLRMHDGDAREVLVWLPDATLGRIFLLHPDPWPKKRHRKRRLVSPETLTAFTRVLRPGGELRFASDDLDYAEVMREAAEASDAFACTNLNSRPADWPETPYERKAILDGRRPAYLIARRRGETRVHPAR